ncbi:MAG: hypothetical protein CMP10_05570 [Zetaproteobacteria bacterium]|nr:hypothetical protein [Pseudobdellovibrionaceae bacterium]
MTENYTENSSEEALNDDAKQADAVDGKIKCLLIDDNYELSQLTLKGLERDFDIDYVPDGYSAHKKVANTKYDIIICDINMPYMDGLMLIEEFQKENIRTPFIFITGNVDEAVSKRAFHLGAYNIIEKPFKFKDLKQKIRLAISLQTSEVDEEISDQEAGYIYNQLKSYYYDFEKIIQNIQQYNVPLSVVSAELEKKGRIGKCLLDNPDNVKNLKAA